MPKPRYTMHQDADRTWSVLVAETEAPLRLAGIPQTGLSRVEAEIMLELLAPKLARTSDGAPLAGSPQPPKRAAA